MEQWSRRCDGEDGTDVKDRSVTTILQAERWHVVPASTQCCVQHEEVLPRGGMRTSEVRAKRAWFRLY